MITRYYEPGSMVDVHQIAAMNKVDGRKPDGAVFHEPAPKITRIVLNGGNEIYMSGEAFDTIQAMFAAMDEHIRRNIG